MTRSRKCASCGEKNGWNVTVTKTRKRKKIFTHLVITKEFECKTPNCTGYAVEHHKSKRRNKKTKTTSKRRKHSN